MSGTDAASWGIPVVVGAVGVVAQVAQQAPFDWLNLTALAALILIALFLTTKFLPTIQKNTADAQIESNKTLTKIQEEYTKTIKSMQEEHSTTLKSISLDHKEALDSIVTKLIQEKKDQREAMNAYAEKQLERVISHYDAQVVRMISLSVSRSEVEEILSSPTNNKGEGS